MSYCAYLRCTAHCVLRCAKSLQSCPTICDPMDHSCYFDTFIHLPVWLPIQWKLSHYITIVQYYYLYSLSCVPICSCMLSIHYVLSIRVISTLIIVALNSSLLIPTCLPYECNSDAFSVFSNWFSCLLICFVTFCQKFYIVY